MSESPAVAEAPAPAGRAHAVVPRVRDMPTISVILPTLNEADNLPWVLERMPPTVTEILVVDGISTDGTPELARELHAAVRVVDEPRKGKGTALKRGFEEAACDVVVTIDGDGSMDPAEIPAFVGALAAGADFAKGSRFMQGGGTDDMELSRKLGNWGLKTAARVAFGGRYTDLCYGYNAFWRNLLPVFEGDAAGFEIETFLNVRALSRGLRVVEIPSYEAPRLTGTSNLRSIPDGFRVLRTILRERRAFGHHYFDARLDMPPVSRRA
jgi:glycosyltransferase involved in cell wall biosynthesis